MRYYLRITLLWLIFFMPKHFGYGGQPPSPPPFLNAQSNDMIHQAPIFLTDTSKFSFVFQYSNVTPTPIDVNIDIDGTFSYTNSGGNFHWDVPRHNISFGIDLKAWSNSYLWSVIKTNNDGNSWHLDFGCGTRMITKDNYTVRFDLGINYVNSTLNSTFIRRTSLDSSYLNYNDDTNVNPFTSLTFYTKNPDWHINILFQASYSYQNLFSINKGWSRDVSSYYSLFTLSPAILYKPDPHILLMLSTRYFIFSGLEDISKTTLISPSVQFNYRL